MGLRFYTQMLNATGGCPGFRGKRKRRMSWTDEKREEVVAAYVAANPTPENSMEVVKEIAEDFEESPNSVRMILSKAGVYVKKTPAKGAAKGTASTRVSKADAQESLIQAIQDAGAEVDNEIISRLTGKASVYFAEVLKAVGN